MLATRKLQSLLIERAPGRLSPSALEKARAQLQSLKFHPREALPNITALDRAEALYRELTGAPRQRLGELIAAFRLALETQESARIEEVRGALAAESKRFKDWH